MKQALCILLILSGLIACRPSEKEEGWCGVSLRPQFDQLDEVDVESDWFKVYEVGKEVYAIAEPYNFQEVISYLIVGEKKALLFDTGMGMESIKPVVEKITDLPVSVINSHTHHDHIGGNHEFDKVFAFDTDFTKRNAEIGYAHEQVAYEVKPNAICLDKIPEFDTAYYKIKPFEVSDFFGGYSDVPTFLLGGRDIAVVKTPGHTPDAIALIDMDNMYIWTGDTFYEGPIYLFDRETDLQAYRQSVNRLAYYAREGIKKVFTSHNTPVANPERLIELADAFENILAGMSFPNELKSDEQKVKYDFEHFSFIIRRDLLPE